MCHISSSAVAGYTVWATFVLAGLFILGTSVNEAKKLTEATEENCEGTYRHNSSMVGSPSPQLGSV